MENRLEGGLSRRECCNKAREILEEILIDQQGWMLAVFTNDLDGREVHLRRVTCQFPTAEFPTCEKLLAKDMDRERERNDELDRPLDDSPLKLAMGFDEEKGCLADNEGQQ